MEFNITKKSYLMNHNRYFNNISIILTIFNYVTFRSQTVETGTLIEKIFWSLFLHDTYVHRGYIAISPTTISQHAVASYVTHSYYNTMGKYCDVHRES